MKKTKNKKQKQQIQKTNAWQNWKPNWKEKSPILKFLFGFLICITAFYICYCSSFFETNFVDPLTNFQAKLSAVMLNIFGQGTTATAGIISAETYSISIKNGCDGMEASAFFALAVLLIPLPFKTKIPGVLIGLSVLFVLNIFRIIGLYFAGLYWPASFDFLHIHGGFVLFTMVSILIWMAWAKWAIQQQQLKINHYA